VWGIVQHHDKEQEQVVAHELEEVLSVELWEWQMGVAGELGIKQLG